MGWGCRHPCWQCGCGERAAARFARVPADPLCRQPFTLINPCLPPPPPPPHLPSPPVSCLAFTCHFNLVPVQCSLKDPSSGHMLRVLQLALAVCVLVYATVAVCGAWC